MAQAILWVFAFVLFCFAASPYAEPIRIRIIAAALAFAALSHVLAVGGPLVGLH